MTPSLRRVGTSQAPVVAIDDFSGDVAAIREVAAALAPFRAARGSYYPGLRRIIEDADIDAFAYVQRTLEAAATFIGGGFDADSFELLEASFSMVTAPADTLSPAQRVPHFDSTDPDYLAVLHYVSDTPGSGTAFYRQRSTGIEQVAADTVDRFVTAAKRESLGLAGYTSASNAAFEQIGMVESAPDRLIIYQGCLLHSGVIPPDMVLSGDPRCGRLTANLFVQARRG